MTSMFPKSRPFTSLVVAVLIATSVIAVIAVIAVVIEQPHGTHRSLAAELGAAYVSGNETVVLRINGIAITNAEFSASRSGYDNLLWSMRDLIDRAVPRDEWTPTPIHDQYRGNLPDDIVDPYKRTLALLEKYGRNKVALADLMVEYARFSEAIEAGHLPPEAEVTEFVQRVRRSHEQHQFESLDADWGFAAVTSGHIEGMGEDKYWSEYYFGQATRRMADDSWIEAVVAEQSDSGESGVEDAIVLKIERQLDQAAIADVYVEIVDPSEVKATPEEAIEYLWELWNALNPALTPPLN